MADEQTPESDFAADIDTAVERYNLDPDWARSVSPQELKYILDRCPFLQIVNPHPSIEDLTNAPDPKLYRADSNWDILDHGDALASSPGRLLYGGGYFHITLDGDDDDDDGGGGPINPGKGTVVNQAFNTAQQMVDIAQALGWNGIDIVDGHPLMCRSAWIRAEELGLSVDGFVPDAHDQLVKRLINRSVEEIAVLRQQKQQGPGNR